MTKKKPPLTLLEQELKATFEKLQIASKDLGPGAGELLQAAALQLARAKLEDVGLLLGLSNLRVSTVQAPAPSKPRVYDFNQLDELDRRTAERLPEPMGLPPCQLCGRPSVYKTKRKMTLCASHQAQGIADDRDDAAQSAIQSQAFGNPEVIRVDPNQFQNGDSP